jgi:hypothetical protein
MISKQALSYDLREIVGLLANRDRHLAAQQLRRIIENLEFLLSPAGGRKNKEASAADELGRHNVEALRAFCGHAAAAVVRGDNDHALAVLHDAQSFWDELPELPGREVR